MKLYKLCILCFMVTAGIIICNNSYSFAHGKEKHQEQKEVINEQGEKIENSVDSAVQQSSKEKKFMNFIMYNLPVYLGIATLISLLITFFTGFLGHRRIIKFNLKMHKMFAYITIALALSHGLWMLIGH